MDNLSGLLDVRKMDRVPNGWIRELCGLIEGSMSVLHWFNYIERMGSDRIDGCIPTELYCSVVIGRIVACNGHLWC